MTQLEPEMDRGDLISCSERDYSVIDNSSLLGGGAINFALSTARATTIDQSAIAINLPELDS